MSAVVTAGMVGERFGQLVVVARHGSHGGSATWHAICNCGKHRIATGKHLRTGHVISCGCAKNDGRSFRSHGRSKTAEFAIWNVMRQRCSNSNNKDWNHYGGRGITVCERWLSFENFLADMGPKPPGLSLERIDNDGNYEPGNCKWATNLEQMRNRRCSIYLTISGERLPLIEWARRYGVRYGTAHRRFRKGVPPELIFK